MLRRHGLRLLQLAQAQQTQLTSAHVGRACFSSVNTVGDSQWSDHAWIAAGLTASGVALYAWPAQAEEKKSVIDLPEGHRHQLTITSVPIEGGAAAHDAQAPATKKSHEIAPLAPGPFQLPPLPYPLNALEPHISADTLFFHYGKHHRAYVENLNKQVAGTELEGKSLGEVMLAAWNGGKPLPAFNNAAQAWNHEFFWTCMSPNGGGAPSGALADAITRDFGSIENFQAEFAAAGAAQFGSGWVWLVTDTEGKLKVLRTGNAVNPMVSEWRVLLTMDVWEHAYYLDYQNRRPDYVRTFLDKLVNWDMAAGRYAEVVGRGEAAQHVVGGKEEEVQPVPPQEDGAKASEE